MQVNLVITEVTQTGSAITNLEQIRVVHKKGDLSLITDPGLIHSIVLVVEGPHGVQVPDQQVGLNLNPN